MQNFVVEEKNIRISAEEIIIGNNVLFGKNINIKCKGRFELGDFSNLGSNVEIAGNNISFGKHLFHSNGLRIGGGGRYHPNANFKIGDRCTIHNNFINVCEPVVIGNDVGLSPETSIVTHGYWLNVLEGYPASFAGVTIHDGVIVGYRCLILMGVEIAKNVVIAAQSVVSKSCDRPKSIYAGTPAVFKKEIIAPDKDKKIEKVNEIIKNYKEIARYHGFDPEIKIEYPLVHFSYNHSTFSVNFETFEYNGNEDEFTDDFRDYIRKWGIRIFTGRPFIARFKF